MNQLTHDGHDGHDVLDTENLQNLYAQTSYRLRESRKGILKLYQVGCEADLLGKIQNGELPQHPAYEHYLSALILEQSRMQIRAELLAQLSSGDSDEAPAISQHLMLKDHIESAYAERLAEPVRLAQDALLLSFDSGLMMEVRYFSTEEYSISWSWGEAELRIDTAPMHAENTSPSHHFHSPEGVVLADSITQPGRDCWLNFSALLNTLLRNPLLVINA